MNQYKLFFVCLFGFLLTASMLFSGCTTTTKSTGKTPQCVTRGKIIQEIAAEAKVEEFSCFYKKWEGAETLHFKVAVKNDAATPQRFRVNIFLDNGKAVGGLIPRKTKKGLVEPGATASFVYPVSGMPEKPGEITLVIKPIAQ